MEATDLLQILKGTQSGVSVIRAHCDITEGSDPLDLAAMLTAGAYFRIKRHYVNNMYATMFVKSQRSGNLACCSYLHNEGPT